MHKFYLSACFAILASLTPFTAVGSYKGFISFTPDERAAHDLALDQIEQGAATCLQRDLRHHQDFLQEHGFSPYYGDRGYFGKLSYAGKASYLQQHRFDPALLSQMEPISCVELMLNCLGEGFDGAGQGTLWARIRQFTLGNDVDGLATQYALELLGWKTLYWNPDTRQNSQWDAREQAKDPTNLKRLWGHHEEFWKLVQRKGRYLNNEVNDSRTLVNFGTRPPPFLQNIPFFVGIAHGGYHVFPGTYGEVVEGHSTRKITDPKSLQSAPFNPEGGGGPTDGSYHSGLITVPGKYIP
jgi:hypothetical protein